MNTDGEKLKRLYRRREILDEARTNASNTLDKYLLSFSTASIYLSLYFRKDLIDDLQNKWLLTTSWLLLLGCIFITLMSFKISEKAHDMQIKIVDTKIQKKDPGQNCWSVALGYINSLSILLFTSGITVLTIFFICNLR